MSRLFLTSLVLLALSSLPGIVLAQDAFTNRPTEMKASPLSDAATVAPLAAETAVKVVGRQSGWTQVQAGTQTGWVRAFHLRFQSVVSGSSEGGALGGVLGGIFGGSKKAAPKGTSTIGVRGLSTEELQSAAPDPQAFAALLGMRTDAASAKRFASDGKLEPIKIDYIEGEAAPEQPARKGGRR
jgi:hypothetical protein